MNTVVIGAGQAGIAVGHHLARRGIDFVALEAGQAPGSSWRERWDSLRLFTPAGFSHLPGMPFPAAPRSLPGKDAVADYLAAYAAPFPIELHTRVDRVCRADPGWEVLAGSRRWRARNVVVATGAHAVPRVPAFAAALDPAIIQLHTADYRRPGQLPPGPVLVVGAGNSGAEIALDLAASHPVWLAGRDVGHVPVLGNGVYRLLRLLGRPGAALAARAPHRGADPLGRVRRGELEAAGIRRLPRVTGGIGGLPVVADGRRIEVATVVWCTGFGPATGFLELGGPTRHRRGIVVGEPGLYLVGLPLQTSMTSHLVGGVGRDAGYVIAHLAARERPAPRR